ncbi:MAG: electron transport complex subunit RsxC [Raoultibacter sp.]
MAQKGFWNTFRALGAASIPHHKDTAELVTSRMPLPREIVLPMQQHIGATCEPVVKKGDIVGVGSLIGHTPKALSADIFSGVSGTVVDVRPVFYSTGKTDTAVVIEADGKQTLSDTVKPPQCSNREEFLAAIKRSGLVGLGGAGFPTDIKLMPPNLEEIDTLLVNGTECEPYLTTDYREIMEHGESVLAGIRTCLHFLGVPQAVLCIEDNKPRAIAYMEKLTAGDPTISVRSLRSQYPQGAENLLVYNVTGRTVLRGLRQTDVGVMLFNVTTMSMIGKFFIDGMPLTRRRLTVAGDAIAHPQNLEVVIGTRIGEIIDFCGLTKEPREIVVGGPMMGNAQIDIDYPIVRQNNSLLVFSRDVPAEDEPTNCIRCGRCTNTCPMHLAPIDIQRAYMLKDIDKLDYLAADLCMGCGVCSYVCPAKRPLAQTGKLARDLMRGELAKRRS